MLYYLPLESYRERYTAQLSAANTGWLERKWIKYGVEYQRVDTPYGTELESIRTGVALDCFRRSKHSLIQIQQLLIMLEEGEILNGDTIYLDDFWTPGIEAVRYCADLMKIKLHIYANCWAQSVDEFDFTYKMRGWIRWFERGCAYIYDGIFVATSMLKDLLVFNNVGPHNKVHVVGHPWDTEEVMSRMPVKYQAFVKGEGEVYPRENAVVWSSRWDSEKNPRCFLEVAEDVIKKVPNVQFYICTSSPKLRSNDPRLLKVLDGYLTEYPDNIFLKENLTKEQYYEILTRSKIQFNSAKQDWISYTLLESSVAGCYPIYPYWRSFPEVLGDSKGETFLYQDDGDAVRKIVRILTDKWVQGWLGTQGDIVDRSWVHTRFDWTWLRMLKIMGLAEVPIKELYIAGFEMERLLSLMLAYPPMREG